MTSSLTASSRDALLDAALRCFAAKGYSATTIKDLASEAQVNSALLYYYFADKETLYRETLRHVARQLGETAGSRLEDGVPPDEAVRASWSSRPSSSLRTPTCRDCCCERCSNIPVGTRRVRSCR